MQDNKELLEQAMLFAQEVDYISVSSLQRKFLIGYGFVAQIDER